MSRVYSPIRRFACARLAVPIDPAAARTRERRTPLAVVTPSIPGTFSQSENRSKIDVHGATNEQTVSVNGLQASDSIGDPTLTVGFTAGSGVSTPRIC
jgi:hypothetical protein